MKKGTRFKKTKKNKIIAKFLYLIFVIMFILSAIKIVIYIKDVVKNKDVIEDVSKSIKIIEDSEANSNKYEIDFNALKQKNNDVCAFLKVNGTDIETIVVKTDNNNYYLNHNFEKKQNNAGWIFADYRNKLDETDKNIIIYGHNMKSNLMFSSLKNILNKDWQENINNREIIFITEKSSYIYKVFSVYQIEEEEYYLKTAFKKGEFNKYLNDMKQRSLYNFNIDVNENDSILTLSTCANNNKYRIVLHAVLAK